MTTPYSDNVNLELQNAADDGGADQAFAMTHDWDSIKERSGPSQPQRNSDLSTSAFDSPLERPQPRTLGEIHDHSTSSQEVSLSPLDGDLPLQPIKAAPAGLLGSLPSGLELENESEECLTEYISQLFDRLGVQSDKAEPLKPGGQSRPSIVPTSSAQSAAAPREPAGTDAMNELPRKPASKVGSQQLSEMRALANLHTRGAVETHHLQGTVRGLYGKLVVSSASMAGALALSSGAGASLVHSNLLATMFICIAAIYSVQFLEGCRQLPRRIKEVNLLEASSSGEQASGGQPIPE